MHTFIREFKEFAMRGNVIDLAVGVVVGTAFGKIVSSLVNDIVMPLISLVLGKVDFTTLKLGPVAVGNFIQASVDFSIIAFAVFLAVKLINKIKK